jgi:uncharacterized protein (TIGR00266 family)
MESHDIDYLIIGDSIQVVEIDLDPHEVVIAEAGAMLYMDQDITFETKMGDGSKPNQGLFRKLFSAGTRILTGESLFITHFTNKGHRKQKVAFSAPYPGTVIPLELSALANNEVIVQKDGFLCAALGTSLNIHFNKKIGSGLVGGEGFILERLRGDGRAFIHAGGTVIEKELNNESIKVDTGCVVAFESTVNFSIASAGGLRSMIFGGEGIFLATLEGTGKVWLQSMPIRKLVQALAPYGSNSKKESSSLFGGFLERS